MDLAGGVAAVALDERVVDALGLEPGEQEVAEGVRADRGGEASGLGVAGEDLADAAVAVWLLQLDSNKNTAPARRWASMCRARVSLNAAGKGTTRSLPCTAPELCVWPDLRFGRVDRLRQDRGLCLSACCT